MSNLRTKFHALGNSERYKIISTLMNMHRSMSVTEIAEHIGLSQSATSQHLSMMHNAGLLSRHRVGTAVMYSLNPASHANDRLFVLIGELK